MNWWLLAGWAVCFVVAIGIANAYFWHTFPTLQRPGEFRDNLGFSCAFSLCGPFSLIVAFFCSGFARHGLMYRDPLRGQK